MTWNTVGNVLLVVAVIPAVVSPIVYSRVTWWRSRWGIHLMSYMLAIAFVLLLGVVRIFFHDTNWFEGLRAFSYVLLVAVLWWRMFFIIQASFEGSPDESNRRT